MSKKKPITIDPEFESLFPPLADEEFAALEESILREGCRHRLILWNGLIVDGHNRYKICMKHGRPFETTELERRDTRESVIAWMIDNQLARRNLPVFKRIELATKKGDLIAVLAKKKKMAGTNQHTSLPSNLTEGSAIDTRNEIAKAAGVSTGTISKFKKIKERAAPELIEKVRSGEVKIDVAAQVATLPTEEQVALAAAGKDAMKAAAKELRQASKRKQSAAREATSEAKESINDPKPDFTSPLDDEDELARLRIENATLRNRVEELTTAAQQAKGEVERLSELCVELNSRIAALKEENDFLAERRNVQDQTDHETGFSTVTVENPPEALVAHLGNDMMVLEAPFPIKLDARAEPDASITIGENVDLGALDQQCAAEGTC
jgi:hypothetical protein